MWSAVRSLMSSLTTRLEAAQLRMLTMRPTKGQVFIVTALFFGFMFSVPHYSKLNPYEMSPFDPVRGVIMGIIFGLVISLFVRSEQDDD